MGLRVLRIGIVDVVGGYQRNPCLLGHLHKLLVHQRLIRYPVILKFQEIIVFTENIPVFKGCLFRLIVKPLHDISLDLPGKTGAQGNDPFMIFSEELLVHTRPVIISLHKAFRDDLHQIRIAFIVLRKKDKVIISVVTARHFPVKPGVGRHIYLAPEDRINSLFLRLTVKVNDTVHNAVICDCGTVHSQLFHPGNIFFYFIRSIQQTVFCMDM